ncbi:MAG TPA: outer membrane beta-barrel protein [Candidatus Acidoferrales bacterium]|nr:outer membrane beta-barrel protein [Candidatus Acidoferrales bacterium]
MRRITIISILVLLCSIAAVAQQDYVGRFDLYGGWAYLNSTNESLVQHGFHTQDGVNLNKWLSFGFDFSTFNGSTSLAPTQLATSYQSQLQQLVGVVATQNPALLPYAATLKIPYNASTWTVTGGPQLSYRGLKWITFFIHPSVGAYHEKVTARPQKSTNPLATPVTDYFISTGTLSSSASKEDTTYFYGLGGGIELNVSKHVHIRMTSDWVRTPLFNNFLKDSVNNVRFSVGPTFNFGKNVAHKGF